jgi:riboflavin kinase/FMN adenylyltransferase
MEVVSRVEGLRPELGPAFVVVGVFDGLHLGHLYLLRHLVAEAEARDAHPTVITFDHHPDEVLKGHAPPLLLDPTERLDRLAEAGVEVTVVQPFDAALRVTTYDTFVERIRAKVELRGFLMTPDAAFGYQRQGTPETLTALGRRDDFDVVVVEPFMLGGRSVRSSEIRSAIAAGDLTEAAALLGRPVTLTGSVTPDDGIGRRLDFDLPMALPPDGEYPGTTDGSPVVLRVAAGIAYLPGRGPAAERVTVELSAPAARAVPARRARGSRSGPSRTRHPTAD